MPNLLDKVLHNLACDQVKILLDRMDTNPECFTPLRAGTWEGPDLTWLDIARHGVFSPLERWAINRKMHQLDLVASRERILETLMGNHFTNVDEKMKDYAWSLAQSKRRP